MKSYKHLLTLLLTISSLAGLLAQTNKKTLNYQAVILDPKAIDIPGASITGQPLNNGKVCLRFSLLNAQGGLDYEETQQVTTDEYGLVNVAIGNGTQASSNSTSIYKSFESIVWTSSIKSLKVSVSFDGCNSFKQVSSQALNYTPYALYAEAVDYKNVRDAPTKLSQFSNDVGYLVPKDLDPIKADIKTNTSQIAMANQTIADNKKSSDAAFLIVNQSISSLDTKVAENTTAINANTGSINTINSKLTDQQNQISDNRNQIAATNNNLNSQIGGLQGQINNTNSTVSNLSGAAEVLSNKSTNVQTDAVSDTKYPSVKAVKTYVDQATQGIALTADLANKANINSQIFTGTPSLPIGTTGVTQTAGDNSTNLATTAYVATAVSAVSGSGSGSGVPYTGATAAVNLGAYDLTVNGLTIGRGGGNVDGNTANGNMSLYSNSSGNSNTAYGYASLYSNTSGSSNIANGNQSLYFNTTGSNNTAIGNASLNKNTEGGDNTANGFGALYRNITGNNNTANGFRSLYSNTTGSANTASGFQAGSNLISGDNNIFIGYSAEPSNSTISNEITLGNSSITTLRAQVTSITALSDRRDKTNIIPIGEGLEFLKKLNPVSFIWNTRDKAKVGIKSAGFIAQELLELQKQSKIGDNLDLVSENNPEKLEARYNNLIPVIVKAIQEESDEKDKEIKVLKDKLTQSLLEKQKQIDDLNKKIDQVLELLKTKK